MSNAKKTSSKPAAERPVIVTTAHRGVFFGYAVDTTGERIDLARCRMCVSWSSDIKGVFGLGTIGPSKSCRIGPALPSFQIRDITGVMEVTPEAAAKWEAAPWS